MRIGFWSSGISLEGIRKKLFKYTFKPVGAIKAHGCVSNSVLPTDHGTKFANFGESNFMTFRTLLNFGNKSNGWGKIVVVSSGIR